MDNNDRLDIIMGELKQNKVAQIGDLAKKCFVSPCTLRRDLIQLEKRGLIHRSYGKVILQEHPNQALPHSIRKNENSHEKQLIGELAATLVKDGNFLLLDPSSTAEQMIPFLRDKRMLSIVTNGARTALLCQESIPDATVYCTGGHLRPTISGFTGSAVMESLKTFRPDILFFSTYAISLENGVMDSNEENLYTKRCMMQVSRKRVYLCDHSKLERQMSRVLCPLEDLDCVVTDRRPSAAWERALERAGVELLYPKNQD